MARLMCVGEMRLERVRHGITLQRLSSGSGISMTRLAAAELGRITLTTEEVRDRRDALRRLAGTEQQENVPMVKRVVYAPGSNYCDVENVPIENVPPQPEAGKDAEWQHRNKAQGEDWEDGCDGRPACWCTHSDEYEQRTIPEAGKDAGRDERVWLCLFDDNSGWVTGYAPSLDLEGSPPPKTRYVRYAPEAELLAERERAEKAEAERDEWKARHDEQILVAREACGASSKYHDERDEARRKLTAAEAERDAALATVERAVTLLERAVADPRNMAFLAEVRAFLAALTASAAKEEKK